MSKPFPLQTLLNLAQSKNDEATRRLGELNKKQHDMQTQLEALQQYRKEYQMRMQATSQGGMDPMLLRNFQEFIYKLDAAIAQQSRAVEQSRLSAQTGRGEFTSARRKLKSFDTLQQRHVETQQKIESKQEQRTTDEHTSRSVAYRMLNTEGQDK
jgi:flagellar FliJ protein